MEGGKTDKNVCPYTHTHHHCRRYNVYTWNNVYRYVYRQLNVMANNETLYTRIKHGRRKDALNETH